MASKTVQFLGIIFQERVSSKEIDYNSLRGVLNRIIDNESVSGDECKTLDLTPNIKADDISPKVILDIFDHQKYLFGRICRKKPNSAILKRDYGSLKPEEVFTPTESRNKGIEVFTYFIIDFKYGIISIANAQDAPGAQILNDIFKNYNNDYLLKFVNIPNENGINLLYNSGNPQITRLQFELPTPDPKFLQGILGVNEEEIVHLVNDNIVTTTVILKAERNKAIEKNKFGVKKIIEILQPKKGKYNHIIIRGKTDEFNNKEFDLHAKYFTYPISVNRFKTVKGIRKEYNLKEITEQFEDGLTTAYERNKDLILAIVNREEK